MCHIQINIEIILTILYSHTFLNFTEKQNVSPAQYSKSLRPKNALEY